MCKLVFLKTISNNFVKRDIFPNSKGRKFPLLLLSMVEEIFPLQMGHFSPPLPSWRHYKRGEKFPTKSKGEKIPTLYLSLWWKKISPGSAMVEEIFPSNGTFFPTQKGRKFPPLLLSKQNTRVFLCYAINAPHFLLFGAKYVLPSLY